jgi:eukaryotic-like serine/threonine-protein kinase
MTGTVDRLATALADRYAIERELGQGGIATVYLAHDLKHDRKVALKVLHPELAATLGPERFQREIRTTARLQHPHILPVLDSGETAGQLWYTMPFVRGESLRDRLQREGQLPVDLAVDLACQVALALDYAHREGVVHRDLKPENILLSDGQALVADFGIAKALSTAGEAQLTETGLAVGTPAYMSPEQAGGGQVDGRSDVYAFGCVVYEMLAGEPPFSGSTPQAMIAKRVLEPVPHVRTLRDSVSVPMEQALLRALAKTPADRFATAGEFARALAQPPSTPDTTHSTAAPQPMVLGDRRVPRGLVTLALGVLLGIGVLLAWLSARPGPRAAGPKRLAVLPFENLGDSADAYFADGMTDEVRGKLAGIPGLEVIARTSSNEYRKTNKPAEVIGGELGVEYLLTATVRWERSGTGAGRVRVSPELVELSSRGPPLTRWQQPFDATLTDVFRVQSDIANRVTTALDVALGTSEKATLETKPTTNPAAYDFYLRGNEYLNRGVAEPDLRVAEGMFQRAIELDSTFALAFAQLSLADDGLYWFYFDRSKERLAKQKEAADRALRLQPDLAEGHLALGFYYYHGHLDYDHALSEFEAARKRQPSNGSVYSGLAAVRRRQGKWSEAMVEGKKAVELNPLSATDLVNEGLTEMFVRAYPEAESYFNRAIEVSPDQATTYRWKGMLYLLWRGDTLSAARVVREALAKAGVEKVAPSLYVGGFGTAALPLSREVLGSAVAQVPIEAFGSDTVGYFLYQAGRHQYGVHPEEARVYFDSARVMLEAQAARHPDDPGFHASLGSTYGELGRHAEAIRESEKAVSLRPISQDAVNGALYRWNLAQILANAGHVDAAIDQLAYMLSVPGLVSVPALRVDHSWDPLRGNPRFQRLVGTQQR